MTLRVLSIQSHVVHGYVGNRSATFPLQVLGIEVDYINSVQFSNHTGYPCVKGQVLNATDLKELYAGLKANGLHRYTHVLTGYVGSAGFLEAVGEIIKDLKQDFPSVKYYCDPVLGDSGELYVPAELIPIYKEKILPLADVILPNQFEAELLTGCSITDEASALSCIRALHTQFNVPTVVISSTDIRSDAHRSSFPNHDCMLGYASRLRPGFQSGDAQTVNQPLSTESVYHESECFEQVRLIIPVLNAEFRGTGDLFSALSLARLEGTSKPGTQSSLVDAFQLVICTLQSVLRRTLFYSNSATSDGTDLTKSALLELKLVQSVDDIRTPPLTNNYVQRIT
ncbi:hypothetical protein EG68_07640 [Paragonimus skrjabini miyazakii]|uniref:Pyridoxal kinase n=1 Tax=Paragonimus skrjabini miyazakii TaxID=59628 RepID=A0A8S9YQY3_9TREM|nr:hypothetical protein EG68_07640 [Paragonimus skrjabini miyazakii]